MYNTYRDHSITKTIRWIILNTTDLLLEKYKTMLQCWLLYFFKVSTSATEIFFSSHYFLAYQEPMYIIQSLRNIELIINHTKTFLTLMLSLGCNMLVFNGGLGLHPFDIGCFRTSSGERVWEGGRYIIWFITLILFGIWSLDGSDPPWGRSSLRSYSVSTRLGASWHRCQCINNTISLSTFLLCLISM